MQEGEFQLGEKYESILKQLIKIRKQLPSSKDKLNHVLARINYHVYGFQCTNQEESEIFLDSFIYPILSELVGVVRQEKGQRMSESTIINMLRRSLDVCVQYQTHSGLRVIASIAKLLTNKQESQNKESNQGNQYYRVGDDNEANQDDIWQLQVQGQERKEQDEYRWVRKQLKMDSLRKQCIQLIMSKLSELPSLKNNLSLTLINQLLSIAKLLRQFIDQTQLNTYLSSLLVQIQNTTNHPTFQLNQSNYLLLKQIIHHLHPISKDLHNWQSKISSWVQCLQKSYINKNQPFKQCESQPKIKDEKSKEFGQDFLNINIPVQNQTDARKSYQDLLDFKNINILDLEQKLEYLIESQQDSCVYTEDFFLMINNCLQKGFFSQIKKIFYIILFLLRKHYFSFQKHIQQLAKTTLELTFIKYLQHQKIPIQKYSLFAQILTNSIDSPNDLNQFLYHLVTKYLYQTQALPNDGVSILSQQSQFVSKVHKQNEMEQKLQLLFQVFNKFQNSQSVVVSEMTLFNAINYPQVFKKLINHTDLQICQKILCQICQLTLQKQIDFQFIKKVFSILNYKSFYLQQNKRIILRKRIPISRKQIKHTDQLFQILQNSLFKSTKQACAKFLAALHSVFLSSNLSQTQQITIDFMKSVIHKIQNFQSNPSATQYQLYGLLSLLKQLLYLTQISGLGSSKSFSSLITTSVIKVKITNLVTKNQIKCYQKQVKSNITIFELLKKLSKCFGCEWKQIRLSTMEGFQIPSQMNGCTLKQLNFGLSNQLRAFRRQEQEQNYLIGISSICEDNMFRNRIKQSVKTYKLLLKLAEYKSQEIRELSRCILVHLPLYEGDESSFFNQKIDLKTLTVFQKIYFMAQLYSQLDKNQTQLNRIKISKQSKNQINSKLNYIDKNSMKNEGQKIRQKHSFQVLMEIQQSQQSQIQQNKQSQWNMINQQNLDKQIESNGRYGKQKQNKIKDLVKMGYDLLIMEEFQNIKFEQDLTEELSTLKVVLINILKLLTNCPPLNHCFIRHDSLNIDKIKSIISNLNQLNLTQSNYESFQILASKCLQQNQFILYQPLLRLLLFMDKLQLKSWLINGVSHQKKSIRLITTQFLLIYSLNWNWPFDFSHFSLQHFPLHFNEWFIILKFTIENNKKCNIFSTISKIIQILKSQKSKMDPFSPFNHIMKGCLWILKSIYTNHKKNIRIQLVQNLVIELLQETINNENRSLLYQLLYFIKPHACLNYMLRIISPIQITQTNELKRNFVGLRNLGATCYINSIIQQFYHISNFKDSIISFCSQKMVQKTQIDRIELVDDFVYQLQRLFINLQFSQKKYFQPKQFCLTIKDQQLRPIDTSIQKDAHQFLNSLFDKIEEDFKITNKLNQIQKIFQGQTICELFCEHCRQKISKVEQFYNLILEVKGVKDLGQSIKKLTNSQWVKDYKCQMCNKRSGVKKQTMIKKAPQVLIVNLKRILFDLESGSMVKVHSRLEFGQYLDISQESKDNQKCDTYRLKGVVIHSGTQTSGHYYSFIRVGEDWYRFNDQTVTAASFQQIKEQSFGGQQKAYYLDGITLSTNAYILFYQSNKNTLNKNSQQTLPSLSNSKIINPLSQINHRHTCQKNQNYNHFSKQNNQQFQNHPHSYPIYQTIHNQNNNNNHLPQKTIQMIQEVQNNNKLFFNQFKINQPSYIDFLSHIYHSVRLQKVFTSNPNVLFYQTWRQTIKPEIYEKLFVIYLHVMKFITVYHSFSQKIFEDITSTLSELITMLPQKTEAILCDQMDELKWVYGLIESPDTKIRNMYEVILSKTILVYTNYFKYSLIYQQNYFQSKKDNISSIQNKSQQKSNISSYKNIKNNSQLGKNNAEQIQNNFSRHKISNQIRSLANIKLQQLLSFLIVLPTSPQFYQNLHKSQQYFQFWYLSLSNNKIIKNFSIQNNFLFILLNLFMTVRQPSNNNKTLSYSQNDKKAPILPHLSFSYLFKSIQVLLKHKKNMKGEMCPKSQQEQIDILYEMSEEESEILGSMSFYKKLLQNCGDEEGHILSTIINGMSYRDKQFSQNISVLFIQSINSLQENIRKSSVLYANVTNLLQCVFKFLQIEDQFKTLRLESILGIGQLIPIKSEQNQHLFSYAMKESNRSQIVRYLSVSCFKEDGIHRPILQSLFEQRQSQTQIWLMTLRMFIKLIHRSKDALIYILRLPPPCYIHQNYLTWILQTVDLWINQHQSSQLSKNTKPLQQSNQNQRLKNPNQIDALNYWNEIKRIITIEINQIQRDVDEIKKTHNISYPVMKRIIGRNKYIEQSDQLKKSNQLGLKNPVKILTFIHETYVLDNLPQKGEGNFYLPDQMFGPGSLESYAMFFVQDNEIRDCDYEIPSQKTIITLSIHTDYPLILEFTLPYFNHSLTIPTGTTIVNYPFIKLHLLQYLSIKQIESKRYFTSLFNINQIDSSPKRSIPQEYTSPQKKIKTQFQKNNSVLKQPNNTIDLTENEYQNISCSQCTLINLRKYSRCEACDNPLK